jgi:DnaA family protein
VEQLPLEVGPAEFAVFESFLPGPNAALVHALQELAALRMRGVLWLWGAGQTGRSHLLQATVTAAAGRGFRSAYLPLGPAGGLVPSALDGMGELDLVALDDIDTVAGQSDWERALFRLFEQIRERGARLVMAASCAPLHAGFQLPDLASRFSAGAIFRVQSLTDDEKIGALQARAAWRGLDLPDEAARFLMARVDRQPAVLFTLLDRLDREALVAQKRLTVPFVKTVLDSGSD